MDRPGSALLAKGLPTISVSSLEHTSSCITTEVLDALFSKLDLYHFILLFPYIINDSHKMLELFISDKMNEV